MKNNSLDDIIKCSVEIASPASSDVSFDKILIVVPQPTGTGTESVATTFEISRAADLLDYGYTEDSEAYVAATVAFSQNPAPSTLLVYARKVVEAASETIAAALANAMADKEFYGIHITSYKTKADVLEAATFAEANEKLFGFEYTDIASMPITSGSYYRTFGIFAGLTEDDAPAANSYMALALMAKCFGYDPGSETFAYKTLSVVAPSSLTTTQKSTLDEANVSSFLRYAGSNITLGGKVLAGEWIDVIRFRDWLKANIQSKVFAVITANRKVPFTDAGIGMIEGAMESALKEGQEVGGIATTSYGSDGVAIPGYTVSVPKASDFTEEEKKSRKLTGCKWTAKLAGAIHAVEIEGFLTF